MERRSGRAAALAATVLLLSVPTESRAAEPFPISKREADGRPPLVLSFVGDIMHHERNSAMPDYDRLYDGVRPLLAVDDLSFANIEFPVDPSREPAGYPLFNGTPDYLSAVVRAGFDVLGLANNHSFDLGAPGTVATGSVVEEIALDRPVYANGLRAAPSAPMELTVIEHRGWRVGFVAVTAFSNLGGAAPHVNLVNYGSAAQRTAFLDRVGEWAAEVDLLVIAVHGGVEYATEPADHKAAFLRDIADAGAHIVWGHHPHVIQPWERRGRGIIMHSTGNFISAQRRYQSPYVPVGRWAPTGDTAVFQVRVETSADGAGVTSVRTPLFTMVDDPVHGLVLRSFEQVLSGELTLAWRAFYLARYSAAHRLLAAPIESRAMQLSRR